MTARLPTVGGDSGNWGDILNTFLQIGHSSAGVNQGPVVENTKSSGFTLDSTYNGTRIVCTAALTITVPTVGTLANGFECEVINDSGGTVTIDGPGSTNISLLDGEVANILEVNSKQRVVRGGSVVIS